MTLVPKFATKRGLASLAVLNLSMLLKTHHSIRSNPPEGMIDENITMTMTNILWLGCHFFFVHLPCHESFCSKTPGSFSHFFWGCLGPWPHQIPATPKELRLMAWHSRARRIRRRASAPWMMAVSMELVWAVVRDGNSEELWISSFVSFLLWRPGDF